MASRFISVSYLGKLRRDSIGAARKRDVRDASLSQVPQPLLREICGVAWPHSLAIVPLCQIVLTPEPISGAH